MTKKPPVNKKIRSEKVRLIDEKGEQLGIVEREKALQISKERELDLVQVTDKVDPPVCKIMDYGKYLYRQEKKDKKNKKTSVLKSIRIGFNTSSHDLETKAKAVQKFLNKGDKVKIEMRLRGREKALGKIATEKVKDFIKIINEKTPIKVERKIKRNPGALTVIIFKE